MQLPAYSDMRRCAGLSVLLLTGVLKWKDCLQYPPAWDTLFWFAVLVGMSGKTHALIKMIMIVIIIIVTIMIITITINNKNKILIKL